MAIGKKNSDDRLTYDGQISIILNVLRLCSSVVEQGTHKPKVASSNLARAIQLHSMNKSSIGF